LRDARLRRPEVHCNQGLWLLLEAVLSPIFDPRLSPEGIESSHFTTFYAMTRQLIRPSKGALDGRRS
jgi:hypothetical protein